MEIEIQNNVPGVSASVRVNQNKDGSFKILFTQMVNKNIGSVKPGETVAIGEREYIVLGHEKGTTAIITKKPTKSMAFGIDGNYARSDVRAYCNGKFYKELCKAVGKDNIIPHTVDLVSDDGSSKGAGVVDNVSILTCDLYRRYREFLPAIDYACWTATRLTTFDNDFARDVRTVGFYGILSWCDCDISRGVRPFCILNSSVLVSYL